MIDTAKFNVPGVSFSQSEGGLELISVINDSASAQITTNGAHIMSFIPAGEKDLLWMSQKSNLAPGKAIRGGVPVCWPWFGKGPQEGFPSHGFARISEWELEAVTALDSGATRIVLKLDSDKGGFPMAAFPFTAHMIFTVSKSLEMTLVMVNRGKEPVKAASALHTYFAVSDIRKVAVSGLENTPFRNHSAGAPKVEGNLQNGEIRFQGEVDNVYFPTQSVVEIVDPGWGRIIRIEKSGSRSTVVWNPWIEKSKAMPDYGDEEYPEMVCVECANAVHDARILEPGIPHQITQKIGLR